MLTQATAVVMVDLVYYIVLDNPPHTLTLNESNDMLKEY